MRLLEARHAERAAAVGEAVAGFIDDRRSRRLAFVCRRKGAALRHEVGDHAVEDGAIVVTFADVAQEVLDCQRCALDLEAHREAAHAGFEADP
jgi:hypothetical protein